MIKSPMDVFFSHFFVQELTFDPGNCCCHCNSAGQIVVSFDKGMKPQPLVEVAQKIQKIEWQPLIACLTPVQCTHLLDNLLRLRQHMSLPGQPLPFCLEVTTQGSPDHFSDVLACRLFAMHHFTTFPTSDPIKAIPTDHAGLKESPDGMTRLGVCDGLGHSDPTGIGRVASAVLTRVLKEPIKDKKHYQEFLRTLAQEYKAQEGTMLLAAQIEKKKSKWKIRMANYSDGAIIILNESGEIKFATKNRVHEKKPHSQDEIGLLGVGSGYGEKLVEYVEFEKISLKEGWVIACSDGLIEHFRDPKGCVDAKKFNAICRTAKDVHELGVQLRQAAINAAKDAKKGDDVSIIVMKLSKI